MHFLAHIVVAQAEPFAEIGQIAADFVRHRDRPNLDKRIGAGYDTHTKIDAFTDTHARVKACKQILDGPYRRYAGLTLDLYFDHLIAQRYHAENAQGYEDYCDAVHARLLAHEAYWPAPMQRFTHYLIDSEMLKDLVQPSVLYRGMIRITRRLNRPIDIDGLVAQVFEHSDALRIEFDAFWLDYVEEFNVVPLFATSESATK